MRCRPRSRAARPCRPPPPASPRPGSSWQYRPWCRRPRCGRHGRRRRRRREGRRRAARFGRAALGEEDVLQRLRLLAFEEPWKSRSSAAMPSAKDAAGWQHASTASTMYGGAASAAAATGKGLAGLAKSLKSWRWRRRCRNRNRSATVVSSLLLPRGPCTYKKGGTPGRSRRVQQPLRAASTLRELTEHVVGDAEPRAAIAPTDAPLVMSSMAFAAPTTRGSRCAARPGGCPCTSGRPSLAGAATRQWRQRRLEAAAEARVAARRRRATTPPALVHLAQGLPTR